MSTASIMQACIVNLSCSMRLFIASMLSISWYPACMIGMSKHPSVDCPSPLEQSVDDTAVTCKVSGGVRPDHCFTALHTSALQAECPSRKDIDATRLEECKSCDNTGVQKGTQARQCTTCGGTGQVVQTMRTPMGAFQQVQKVFLPFFETESAHAELSAHRGCFQCTKGHCAWQG